MRVIDWLLDPTPRVLKSSDAVRWWELRRIPYNIIVGAVGGLSVVVMELLGNLVVRPGEDFEEPRVLIFGIILFGFLANVGYTLGWILELRLPASNTQLRRAFRAKNFRRGLLWSCFLASAPVWISIIVLAAHEFGKWLGR